MAGKSRSFTSFRTKLMTVVPVENHKKDDNNHQVDPPDLSALIQPNYSKLSEGLRKNTPTSVMCIAFCGGRKCRFDTADGWSSEDMAIDGLYSHWITDRVLATARPNSQIIQQKDVVGQFVRSGIRTVINLQTPGEHSHCGPPLTSSGFSYLPEIFMEKDIYYYNFGWKDYEQGSLEGLLDAVKVLSFAVTQGKVAVHCHAGLGRTGVLLCCYLIYSQRIKAVEAIRFIRRKRPNAVQTSGQITMVQTFEQFLINRSNIFSVSNKDGTNQSPFTLHQHLENQKEILHGYEARTLRYIPKIVYVICERLLILCRADPSPLLNYWMDEKKPPFTRSFLCFVDVKNPQRQPYRDGGQRGGSQELNMTDEEAGPVPGHPSHPMKYGPALSCDETQVSTEQVVRGLVPNPPSDLSGLPAVKDYCRELDGRHSGWMSLSSEREPQVLGALLWHWFLHLKQPILTNQELGYVVIYADKPVICFSRFDQPISYTVEYLLRFIQRLSLGRVAQSDLLRQLTSVLTHQAVEIHGLQYPGDGRKRLGQGTLTQLLHFFNSTIQLLNPVDRSSGTIQE